jgi:MFS transporter, DHA2 family, glioxin efflux transporter
VSAAQNIMNNIIIKSLLTNNPNISPAKVLTAGSASVRDAFPDPEDYAIVIDAYMNGLRAAWIWSIVLAGLSFLLAFLAEWKSVRPEDVKKRNEAKVATA